MSLRSSLRRTAVGLAAAAGLLVAPSVALATAQSGSITPCSTCTPSSSTFTAGGDTSITLQTVYDSTAGTPTGITTILTPGVLTNLAGDPLCEEPGGTNESSNSQPCFVGSGTVDGTAHQFDVFLTAAANPLLNAAGFDLVDHTTRTVEAHADLGVRQLTSGPGAGEVVGELFLTGPGPSYGSLPTYFTTGATGLTVHTNGELVNVPGTPALTRMPSICSPPQASKATVTYSGTPSSETTDATPDVNVASTCGALPFAPHIAASATKDSGDNGVAVSTTIAQAPGEASPRSSTLTVPNSTLQPNISAAIALLNSGKAVGSATETSPLLPAPISGPAKLVGTLAAPELQITLPGCAAALAGVSCGSAGTFNLTGTINPLTNALTFPQLPDVPQTSLVVDLTGGPNALFITSCKSPNGTVTASFTGQNGKQFNTNASLHVNGCAAAVGPSASSGKFSGLKKGKPKLSFKLSGGSSKLKSFSVKLPGGLSFNKKKVKKSLKLSGVKVASAKVKGGKLVVTLKSAASSFTVSVKSPGLKESKGLRKKVKKHKVKSLSVKISVTSSTGTNTSLTLKITKIS